MIEHVSQQHLTMAELEAGLAEIRRSPQAEGPLQLIIRRPQTGEREALDEVELDLVEGVKGDNWRSRGSASMADGSANPDAQVTIMNARVAALVAQDKSRWSLAGDQLYLDLDLSEENLPAGSQLALGSAILEISALPHTGCQKFVERFGADAMKFVNSPLGRQLHLRGINAKVIRPGTIRVGDVAKKL
jgi:hypothetical protein